MAKIKETKPDSLPPQGEAKVTTPQDVQANNTATPNESIKQPDNAVLTVMTDPNFHGEMSNVVAEKSPEDDQPMVRHPYKGYSLSDNAIMQNGKLSLQPDLLCRHLNCECYFIDQMFDWGANPMGGSPTPVIYTREFPQAKILYDHFDIHPEDKILNYKKELAHQHGYRYIYQSNKAILTSEELDKQLAAEKPFRK